MDESIVAALGLADAETRLPPIVIERDEGGEVVALRDAVQVRVGDGDQTLALRPIRELFKGDRRPGDLSRRRRACTCRCGT